MRRFLPVLSALLLVTACDEELVCPEGESDCGRCVSLLTDARHCGACGVRCGENEVCSAGACTCAPGADACGDACAVLASDPDHCGACDAACGDAQVCSAATCASGCGAGLTNCDRACVDVGSDRFHCGACGHACAAGQACRAGACVSDLLVACFATDDVRAATADLEVVDAPPRETGDGPLSLAIGNGVAYAVSSLTPAVATIPIDTSLGGTVRVLEDAEDLEFVVAHEGLLFVSNAGFGSLLVYDPARAAVLDEIPLGAPDVNPKGIAFAGTRAFVALYGMDEKTGGQAVAVVDFSSLRTCATASGASRPPCGFLEKTIELRDVPGASDAPGLPFPGYVAAHEGRVYVTLANMKKSTAGPAAGFYVDPAGPAKLAVIDTSRGDALSFVGLGPCNNAGDSALLGETLWVSCADANAPGLLAVELSGAAPAPAAELVEVPANAPGSLAFCGGMGYVTDQWSGNVVRFDPAGATAPVAREICPVMEVFALASDVACAP